MTMRVVHLTGIIDYKTARAARRQLLMALNSDDLYIDFSDVKQIDSSCLATLVEIFQVARESDRKVHLINLNGEVRKMVNLAHLEGIFSLGKCDKGPTIH